MTRAEVIAWTQKSGSRVDGAALNSAPLTEKQRIRLKALRWEAAEEARRSEALRPSLREGERRAVAKAR